MPKQIALSFLASCAFLLFAASAYGQKGILVAKVTLEDPPERRPSIFLILSGQGVRSYDGTPDEPITWTVPPGEWNLTIVAKGYQKEQRRILISSDPPPLKLPDLNPIILSKQDPPPATPPRGPAASNLIVLVLHRAGLMRPAQTSAPCWNESPVTVKDSSKAPIDKAMVTVFRFGEEGRQQLAAAQSDSKGVFTLKLGPRGTGEHLLVVTREGFDPYVLPLEPQDCIPAELELTPEDPVVATSQVAYQLQRDYVETTTPDRRFIIDPRFMEALPVPGQRSFDWFVHLLPGVVPTAPGGTDKGPGITGSVGSPGQFAVNGLPSRENNFTIDGADNNDEETGTRRQGFVSLVPQPIESIDELQVTTLLADTRFGRNAGAQVNALSKSGARGFHGSLFGFFTNRQLNARDHFDQIADADLIQVPVLSRSGAPVLLDQQPLRVPYGAGAEDSMTRRYGGLTLSGPLALNSTRETFFFTSVDRRRNTQNKETHFAVPTIDQRGIFATGMEGFQVARTGARPLFSPASLAGSAVFSLYPFPNNPAGPYGGNTFTDLIPADAEDHRWTIKVDHRFDAVRRADESSAAGKTLGLRLGGNVVAIRYSQTRERSLLPTVGDALGSSIQPRVATRNLAGTYNRTISTTASDSFRFTYGRTALSFEESLRGWQMPSGFFPDIPFLLNAPLLVSGIGVDGVSSTLLSANSPAGRRVLGSAGIPPFQQTEALTGPLGQVMIAGFSPVGVDALSFPQRRANNTFQFGYGRDHFYTDQHWSAGLDVRLTQINSMLDRNFRPSIGFNGVRNSGNAASWVPLSRVNGAPIDQRTFSGATLAAAAIPTGIFQTLAQVPDSTVGIRFSQINLYLQNQFKVHRDVSVTAGLRYEINTTPTTEERRIEDAFNRNRLFDEARQVLTTPGCANNRCSNLISGLGTVFPEGFAIRFGGDLHDFAPRIGLAWDVGGRRKIAVRGGWSLFSGQFPGVVVGDARNAFPKFLPVNMLRPAVGPFLFNPANPLLAGRPGAVDIVEPGTLNTLRNGTGASPLSILINDLQRSPSDVVGLDLVVHQQKDLKTPYAHHVLATVEAQLSSDFVAAVSYVATHGRKLLRKSTPDSGINGSGVSLPMNAIQTTAPLSFFNGTVELPQSRVLEIANSFVVAKITESNARSSYHSLQMELRKRHARNYQVMSSLTYSHAIDEVSDIFDSMRSLALPQNSIVESERGDADFDVRLRSATAFVWDLPSPPNGWWKRGWRVAGVAAAQSGQPFTVNSTFDLNRDGNLTDRPDSIDRLRANAAGDRRQVLRLEPGQDPSIFWAPDGRDGVLGRNTFRSRGIFNVDLAVSKNLAGRESRVIAARLEMFNVMNRTHFGVPVRFLEAPGFGASTSTILPARSVQISLKASF